jgi:hypothetical protein
LPHTTLEVGDIPARNRGVNSQASARQTIIRTL